MRAILASLALAGTALTALPGTAVAQADDARLRKLEAEIRALQRKVFPGGDGRYFTPEIAPAPPAQPQQPAGTPSTSAVTDLLARLDSVEAQLARLTAATEVNTHMVTRLEERIEALEAGSVSASSAEPPSGTIPVPGGAAPAARAAANPPPAAQAPAAPSAERIARVQAIAKPDTGDAGEDEYTYGFRLWEAGLYPEAQQQLKLFLDKYPGHPRATYGRNLLGRAHLDAGQPREAAVYFLQNFQADKQAARAPDSLLFLAEAMIAMKDTNRACIALAEFGDTYPGLATGRLRDQYEADRAKVTCKT